MFTLSNYVAENYFSNLLQYPNVIGCGVGFKVRNNKMTRTPALAVFVNKKYSKDCFSKENLIPSNYMGAVTDIVEMPNANLTSFYSKVRPVQMGYAISLNFEIGTAGCIVVKNNATNPLEKLQHYILTCAHLLTYDFLVTNPIGFNAFQPRMDRSSIPNNLIGTVSDIVNVKPTTNTATPVNIADAGLIKVKDSNISIPTITQIGVPNGINTVKVNDKVKFVGATSGVGMGIVLYNNVSINHTFESVLGSFRFEKEIITTRMLNKGDSGAVLLSMDNKILGLGFSTNPEFSYWNSISSVMSELNVTPYFESPV